MSGPINSIFAAVTARMAQWTDLNQAEDGVVYPYGNAPAWSFLNATHLHEASVPPRVVWVPLQETFYAAIGQGGSGVNNPRPVATRVSEFAIHLWAAAQPQTGQADQNAADLDACERLLNAFMWAVYSVVHGAPALPFIGTGRWARSNVDGQLLTLGIAYILPVTIQIPVTRPKELNATITEIPATIAMPNNSVLVDIV